MNSGKQDFGKFLRSVEERDVDLLLMEEFHVSPKFVVWFCEKLGLNHVEFDGAWHSVSDYDGETDLLLRIRCGGRRIAVFIENKIAAPEQHEQGARYHLRALRAKDAGQCDEYLTCICAPKFYLSGLAHESRYEYRIPYEAIQEWYGAQSGPRSAWRSQVISAAISQGRRGYTMIENPTKTNFHRAYWKYLVRHHPDILMREPKTKGAKSDWMVLWTVDMPKGVKFIHKNDQGCIDLDFPRTKAATLRAARETWPADFIIRQKGGSAVLSVAVTKMDMSLGVAAQAHILEEAIAVMRRLLPFAQVLANRE